MLGYGALKFGGPSLCYLRRCCPPGVIAGALCCVALSGLMPAAAEQLYKWTDEEGNVHFSQTPPPAAERREVETLEIRAAPPSGVGGGNAQETLQGLDERRAKRAEESERQAKTKEEEALRKQNCESARQRVQALSGFKRLRHKQADGEYRYYTEEERNSEIESAQAVADEFCS